MILDLVIYKVSHLSGVMMEIPVFLFPQKLIGKGLTQVLWLAEAPPQGRGSFEGGREWRPRPQVGKRAAESQEGGFWVSPARYLSINLSIYLPIYPSIFYPRSTGQNPTTGSRLARGWEMSSLREIPASNVDGGVTQVESELPGP